MFRGLNLKIWTLHGNKSPPSFTEHICHFRPEEDRIVPVQLQLAGRVVLARGRPLPPPHPPVVGGQTPRPRLGVPLPPRARSAEKVCAVPHRETPRADPARRSKHSR